MYFFSSKSHLAPPKPTDISKLLPKKGGNKKSTTLFEVSGLGFFCCYSLPHPNNQVNRSTRKPFHFQVPACARELVHFGCFFQQLLSCCLRDSSLQEVCIKISGRKKVCMYTPRQKKRNKKHTIPGIGSHNPCRGLRGLVNSFRFWKQSARKRHGGR